ncbi:uncharacterized protein DUF1232 [Pseudomonas duriflava]|uniref:Uncharacterized protein DUF1232 n=1 Tax=Pseudomonas duriflava TaxID=459528 RepID=A0A562QFZ2_9PSED|nr:DUF1232 domain-containing protein [Pseudomonas duriflava]TWI55639.1 uncharacterized protein DUF1232 [Pseudomonas duriflava]
MRPPIGFDRYIRLAQRFLIRGRLPALLLAVGRKVGKKGFRLGAAKETLGLFHSLLLAWWRGQYRGVDRKAILTIMGALLYFLSPIDVIPDWMLTFGFIDDLAVLAWVAKTWKKELDAFKAWRDTQPVSLRQSLNAPPAPAEKPAHGVVIIEKT